MSWLFPRFFGRPHDLLCEPVVSDKLPATNARWFGAAPQCQIPNTCAILEGVDGGFESWSKGGDCEFLLAPWPQAESLAELLDLVASLKPTTPVALYEDFLPVLPNVVINGDKPANDNSARALQVIRSGLRANGKGFSEAFVLLPAGRLSYVLRGSSMAVKQPAPGASLQNRRYLHHLLDHSRSLSLLSQLSGEAGSSKPCRRLILAPHFDDECLLFSGEIRQSQQRGDELKLVWLTDGGSRASQRQSEADAASKELRVEDTSSCGFPETKLGPSRANVQKLRRLLLDFEPQEICLPWWLDNHIDHYETTRLLAAALPKSLHRTRISLSGFWTPMPQQESHSRLNEAMQCHESQLANLDYLRISQHLSAWQGWSPAGGGTISAQDYLACFRASGSEKRKYRN